MYEKPKMHKKYELTIETLSSLHIGTGNILKYEFDYVTRRNRTYVIDTDVMAELLFDEDDRAFEEMVNGVPGGQFLHKDDYKDDSPLFRYILRGEPRSVKPGAELQELIKDPWDRPYIPGSSLKGALRTALLYMGFVQRDKKFSMKQVNRSGDRRFAAQPLEEELLTGDYSRSINKQNRDLGRFLQVSDSLPDESQNMEVANVSILTGEKSEAPIELEAVRKGTTFKMMLTIDGMINKRDVRDQLGIQKDQRQWLRNLPTVVNYWSDIRIEQERRRPGVSDSWAGLVHYLHEQYAGNKLDDNQFILQLGWGGGWDSKTLGVLLQENKDEFYKLMQKYNLGKNYEHDDPFPKSRRVVMKKQGEEPNVSYVPRFTLGWVKVTMEKME